MKKILNIILLSALALSVASCVTIRKYEESIDEYDSLLLSNQKLKAQLALVQDSTGQIQALLGAIDSLQDANLALSLKAKKATANQHQLDSIMDALQQQDLNAKAELERLRKTLSDALMGFAKKGIDVNVRDGKVYVSMASKLLFATGSWEISKAGLSAIRQLARVLEDNPDLDIMVEGHTDNAPYLPGTTGDVRDNWDLSVMRATAIVKQLLADGPLITPSRIVASGHGEFQPVASNATPEGKQQNRRTEIILTPKLTALYQIIETSSSKENTK